MKRIISSLLLAAVFAAIALLSGCGEKTAEDTLVLRANLKKEESYSYDFMLNDDGVLEVGKREAALTFRDYENAENYLEKTAVTLSKDDFDRLVTAQKEMGGFSGEKDEDVPNGVFWDASLYRNNYYIFFTYGNAQNEKYDALMTELIRLSPVAIVDAEGEPAAPYAEK